MENRYSIKFVVISSIISILITVGFSYLLHYISQIKLEESFQEVKNDNESLKQQVTDLGSQSVSIEIFQKYWAEMKSMINNSTESQVTVEDSTESQVTATETTQKIEDYQTLIFEAPDHIPSDTYTTEINKNQIGVLTCGPVRINDIFLPGGADPDRGSVVVLLPEGDKTTIYNFYELVPGHNWFGIYNVNEVNPNNVNILTNKHINEMRLPPNGTSGNGCKIIDVLVLLGQNIYSGPKTLQF